MSDDNRQLPATSASAGVAADVLFGRIAAIIDGARGCVARVVNSTMVQAYWEVGREIVLVEQQGNKRAVYGEQVLEYLSERMTDRFGAGFGIRNLQRMRQFYIQYADRITARNTQVAINENDVQIIPSALRTESTSPVPLRFSPGLSWAHYRLLSSVPDAAARSYYEIEAAREGWSSRELERQIASLLFERLAASRDKASVLALAQRGQEIAVPQDIVKDPVVLEFLGLSERPHWRERDLEQAIINHLQEFLLELGRGFCFVARQKRITLDGDHFFVDLVLYNRLLQCFVLIDLKLGKLTHRDLGQLQMYVNWYDRTQREAHEQPAVGIALCSRKNDAVVRMTLPEGERRILATRYEVLLPSTQELEAAVNEGRREALSRC
ncbi:MAG: PDDEXK nuclease domain-containing protein [bacterium]|nr:PDDEXK nuclease domain-containing protein [bacterium]